MRARQTPFTLGSTCPAVLLVCAALLWSGITPAPAATEPAFTLALAGDVMLGRQVDVAMQTHGPEYVWGDVLPLLRGADLFIANLETVIAGPTPRFMPERVFYFRAEPEPALTALELAGVDCVSLANNHAMDHTAAGLTETIRHLDEHGIAHAGAGRDLAAAARPAWLEVDGVKIAVLAFADHFREYAAGPDSPGINRIRVDTEGDDFRRVRTAIDAARAAGADLVVFSIHWGPNMREAPTPRFVRFARAVIDAGADLFHGHSAHVFQGIEIYRGKPILYDTGDLVDDYYVDRRLRNDRQLLFLVHWTGTRPTGIELVPLRIAYARVNRAEGPDFDAIAERARALSGRFGTGIRRQGHGLFIDVR
jgi:poly-gamma-glutamate synthesis protein (capsule biosynthesis protein)